MPECVRKPCPSCPWRVEETPDTIPNFSLELAEGLVATVSGELGAPIFACHLSQFGEEFPCAGWLAAEGHNHIGVRLMVLQGRLSVAALAPQDGWPELHETFGDMIEKLRRSA